MKKVKYLPEGADKSSKMQSENLLTTAKYRENFDKIFKDSTKRKGSTI